MDYWDVRLVTLYECRSHVIHVNYVVSSWFQSACVSALSYFVLKNSIAISFDVIEVNFIITAQPAPLTRIGGSWQKMDGWTLHLYFHATKMSRFCPSVNFQSFYLLRQWGSLFWVTSYSYIYFCLHPFNYIQSVMGLIGRVSHWL